MVERIVGITDYETMFENTAPEKAHGLHALHSARISSKEDGLGLDVFYKCNASQDGWLPRPVPGIVCDLWKERFEHPTSLNQGIYMIRIKDND